MNTHWEKTSDVFANIKVYELLGRFIGMSVALDSSESAMVPMQITLALM
jgi:hypothetical protein